MISRALYGRAYDAGHAQGERDGYAAAEAALREDLSFRETAYLAFTRAFREFEELFGTVDFADTVARVKGLAGELEAARDRLRTIIDEAFGMQPPIADADLLTELERLLRAKGSALQSALLRIEMQETTLAKPEDERLRDVIDALDWRAPMLDSPADRVRWLLRELDEWTARAGEAERERDRLRKLFDDKADDRLREIGDLLKANGCDCDCEHHPEEHGDDCERCLACLVNDVLVGEKR